MADTKKLSDSERELAKRILNRTRDEIAVAGNGDNDLQFAIRRYICKQLEYDERGKPAERKKLKMKKWISQKGICPDCLQELPEKGAELDRIDPMSGYTDANTRLIHHQCHRTNQEKKGFGG